VPGTHPWYIDPYSSASGEACWYVDEQWRSAFIIRKPSTWMLQHFDDSRPPPRKPKKSKTPPGV
jgi:hypothetical protein